MSPESLCSQKHYAALKRGIAKRFRDGKGEVTCCYSNGCNLSLELARQSLQILERPMKSHEIVSIQQKAENIARLKQIEFARNTNVMAARNFHFDDGNLTLKLKLLILLKLKLKLIN